MKFPSLLSLSPLLLLLVSSSSLATAGSPPSSQHFTNTAIVRTIDLAGATSLITTTYTARAASDSLDTYAISLGPHEVAHFASLDVKEKKAKGAASAAGPQSLSWLKGPWDDQRSALLCFLILLVFSVSVTFALCGPPSDRLYISSLRVQLSSVLARRVHSRGQASLRVRKGRWGLLSLVSSFVQLVSSTRFVMSTPTSPTFGSGPHSKEHDILVVHLAHTFSSLHGFVLSSVHP